jgi:GLPGLI family protein
MRKINFYVIIMALLFLLPAVPSLAKDFKGTITYKVTVTGPEVTDEVKAMMPKTMVLKISGGKTRSEMVMGMGKTVVIADAETKTSVILMDIMGQKMAVESTTEDIMKELNESPEYKMEKTSETKNILDYTCKNAIITSDEGIEISVFYTEELGNGAIYFDDPQFKEIEGMMLEFEIPNQGVNMKFTAISIDKKKISDSEFEIPEDYKVMSKEEMQGMFGGF